MNYQERWYLLVPGVIIMLLPSLLLASVILVFVLLILMAEPFKLMLRRDRPIHPTWYFFFKDWDVPKYYVRPSTQSEHTLTTL